MNLGRRLRDFGMQELMISVLTVVSARGME